MSRFCKHGNLAEYGCSKCHDEKSNSDEKPTVRIENWELLYLDGCSQRLRGVVNEHPKQPMGMGFGVVIPSWNVTTGKIIKLSLKDNYAETSNTKYTLGKALVRDETIEGKECPKLQ